MKQIKYTNKEEFFATCRKMQKTRNKVGLKPDPEHEGVLNLDITKEDEKNAVEHICETFYYDYVFTVFPNKRYSYFLSKHPSINKQAIPTPKVDKHGQYVLNLF